MNKDIGRGKRDNRKTATVVIIEPDALLRAALAHASRQVHAHGLTIEFAALRDLANLANNRLQTLLISADALPNPIATAVGELRSRLRGVRLLCLASVNQRHRFLHADPSLFDGFLCSDEPTPENLASEWVEVEVTRAFISSRARALLNSAETTELDHFMRLPLKTRHYAEFVAAGMDDNQVAEQMCVTRFAVDKQVRILMRHYRAQTRRELIARMRVWFRGGYRFSYLDDRDAKLHCETAMNNCSQFPPRLPEILIATVDWLRPLFLDFSVVPNR